MSEQTLREMVLADTSMTQFVRRGVYAIAEHAIREADRLARDTWTVHVVVRSDNGFWVVLENRHRVVWLT
jgi:hypothetical protein